RGLLRPSELLGGLLIALALSQGGDETLDLARWNTFCCGSHGLSVIPGSGGVFVQPAADDGYGFVRILVGEFADLLHGLGVNLALDLGDIDHGRGAVGDRNRLVAADDGDVGAARGGDAA